MAKSWTISWTSTTGLRRGWWSTGDRGELLRPQSCTPLAPRPSPRPGPPPHLLRPHSCTALAPRPSPRPGPPPKKRSLALASHCRSRDRTPRGEREGQPIAGGGKGIRALGSGERAPGWLRGGRRRAWMTGGGRMAGGCRSLERSRNEIKSLTRRKLSGTEL